uniref:Uncharacterized protein n=1 Tax=Palpitomonas bilix TaxID=652834 RepID=A0A7S3D737_9EUKA|mmetsp:Transcript_24470/g.61950  ORF Transcript_24470/g.61950 Transcript_24470/m.61950 type:complete len:192 (+) Transcript_24470:185-760(+)
MMASRRIAVSYCRLLPISRQANTGTSLLASSRPFTSNAHLLSEKQGGGDGEKLSSQTSGGKKGIRVFYDGHCPMCKSEVEHYERLKGSLPLPQLGPGFVNIHSNEVKEEMKKAGITKKQALDEMHVIDADGKVHSGADAFVVIWKELPYWRHFATFTKVPGVMTIAHVMYRAFANNRQTMSKFFIALTGRK